MATTILTEAAVIALVPAGLLMYIILDRYTTPRVATTLFDEKQLLLAFVVGIPAGLPLTVIFLIYSGSLESAELIPAIAYLLLFVAVANLGRMLFLKIKRFASGNLGEPKTLFNTFAFGCGTAVTIILGASSSGLYAGPPLEALILLLSLSFNMALLEAWAGLRYSGKHTNHGWSLYVAGVEGMALLVIAPLYLGVAYVNEAGLLLLIAVLSFMLHGEELRSLRPLLDTRELPLNAKPFGRVGAQRK